MDDQWPSGFLPPPLIRSEEAEERRLALRNHLEDWLSNRWGTNCFIVPSGRAGIALALRYLNTNRAHVLYAPKWSSHCVWDVLGRFGNPTCINPEQADVILAVHKYGLPTSYTAKPKAVIIEDACDALIPPDASLFPNNSQFSILSLPKIAGTWCGGVLAVSNDKDATGIARLRDSIPFDRLAISQGEKRWLAAGGKLGEFDAWSTLEYRNAHPDLTCLDFLQKNLAEALEKNTSTIKERLDRLSKIAAFSRWIGNRKNSGWLPPVLPVPENSAHDSGLMTRQVSLSGDENNPDFQPCRLIPLHFGIDNKKFSDIYTRLKLVV